MNSIAEYLRICRDEKRLGPKTLRLYERELVILSQLGTAEAIRTHLAKLSPATCIRKLVIWRSFAKVTHSDLLPILTSMHRPKLKQREPEILSRAEVKHLRSLIQILPLADQMFFELGLTMGLRTSEIRRLKKSDFEDDRLFLVRKGDHEQRLRVSREVKALLPKIEVEHICTKSHVYYWKLVKAMMRDAGIDKKISPHSLRHTFASAKANSGKSLVVLKEYLGHSDMKTTQKYLHSSEEYQSEFMEG